MPQLILLYARQLVAKKSQLDKEYVVRSFAYVYISAVEPIHTQKRLDVWDVPERLSPI